MKNDAKQVISLETNAIKAKIYLIRNQQVMMDKDIAALYEVKPIRLREQVQRNIDRFPDDFMFQLSKSEVDLMVSQNAIPSRKHLGGSLPYVFTEQGVASLSGVLKSAKATEVHVKIMRAFVEMRKFIQHNANIFTRLDLVERRQITFESEAGKNFEKIFQALEAGEPPKQRIFYDETISKQLALDLEKHIQQYPPITVEIFKEAHDRFLIIDGGEIYHFGASLKDLGK